MSKKVVINDCYGDFNISEQAVRLARELSGNPKWGDCALNGKPYKDGSIRELFCDSNYPNVERTDPILVQVVEQLGKAANGSCADLKIVVVTGKYRIIEYGGAELIETPEDIEWSE